MTDANSANPGYGIFPEVLEPQECDGLIGSLAEVERSRAGARHVLGHPAVYALARDPRLIRLAREFLGASPFPFRATLFDKSAGSNWLVFWHQDTALPLETRFESEGWGPWSSKKGVLYAHAPTWALSRVIALRVHLDDSHAHNGPLSVLPASHARGVLSDDDVLATVRSSLPVACLVPKGGVLAMRPLLIHSSPKATSCAPRRVLHIEYADARVLGPGIELAIA